MTLRARLLLGYGYLMLLILLTAGSAALGFYQISRAIDQILRENFDSVAAAVDMFEALDRQTPVALEALLDERAAEGTRDAEAGVRSLAASDAALDEAVARARTTATIAGEEAVVARLEERIAEYRAVRSRLLELEAERTPTAYRTELFPAYFRVKSAVYELLELNYRAINVADRDARMLAIQMAGWLGLLVFVALVSMILLARLLQRHILARLASLADSAEDILMGDLSRRFELSESDELGVVARQLNAALDARDELQSEARGRHNQQKQLVLGLLEVQPEPCLLIGLDGQVIASTWSDESPELCEPILAWLLEQRTALLERFREQHQPVTAELSAGPRWQARVELLAADGRRPVGWLVRLHSV